jgi:hypothetical protein
MMVRWNEPNIKLALQLFLVSTEFREPRVFFVFTEVTRNVGRVQSNQPQTKQQTTTNKDNFQHAH